MVKNWYGIDIADTLRYLLLGAPDGTQENIEVKCISTCLIINHSLQLALRSPGEIYEIISLTRLALYSDRCLVFIFHDYTTLSLCVSHHTPVQPTGDTD